MTTGARTNLTHVVLGFCIMVLGILLVLDRLGIVDAIQAIQFWPVALILLGAAFVVQAIRGGPDGAAGANRFPLGAVIWLVLIGLFFTHVFERRGDAARGDVQHNIRLFAMMSGDRRVSTGEPFRGAEMTSVMGGTQLDLRQATIPPGGEAVIDVFTLMGGAIVYMPQDWTLDIQTMSVMGGVKDERAGRASGERDDRRRGRGRGQAAEDLPLPPPPPVDTPPPSDIVERDDQSPVAGPKPRIVLRGYVMMGGLVIRS